MKRQIAVRRKLALQLYIPANNVSRRLRDGFPGFSVFPSINHKNTILVPEMPPAKQEFR